MEEARKTIAVFGSPANEGSPHYREAYDLGRSLRQECCAQRRLPRQHGSRQPRAR
jgi:hypothetical protein